MSDAREVISHIRRVVPDQRLQRKLIDEVGTAMAYASSRPTEARKRMQAIANNLSPAERGPVYELIATLGSGGAEARTPVQLDSSLVFIIHGRNERAVAATTLFLRAIGLSSLPFKRVLADLGGSPFVGDVVRAGVSRAHAVICLITADEFAVLRPEFREPGELGASVRRWQARPNVIFEAGMALAMKEDRTILVRIGNAEVFSDVFGRHVLRLDNTAESRGDLRDRLIGMGCSVDHRATDWLKPTVSGDFDAAVAAVSETMPRDPFGSAEAPEH